jgi:uncharacterized membrane protein YjgN (DUF898 family)
MKTYFDFTLTGKKFLPIWIAFYLIVIIPYGLYYKSILNYSKSTDPNPLIGLMFLGIMLVAFFISFFIFKVSIENIKYRDNQIVFNGRFITYIGKVLLGLLLSFITLTIYMAWFIKNMTKFFTNNSSINGSNFQFLGKGGRLFLILLATLIAPIIIITLLLGKFILTINENFIYMFTYQAFIMIILIPYMYSCYKWMFDIKYKDYHIKWETHFGKSCLKILLEIFLSIITLGIYSPLAILKLYKYFSERTIAINDNETIRFGYDINNLEDFLFIWGQTLLTLITIGIYYPWAYSKIGKRVLSKTYLIK